MLQESLQIWAQEVHSNLQVDSLLMQQEQRLQQLEHDLQQISLQQQQQQQQDGLSTLLQMEQQQETEMQIILSSLSSLTKKKKKKASKSTPATKPMDTTSKTNDYSSRPRPCPESLVHNAFWLANQSNHHSNRNHHPNNNNKQDKENTKIIQEKIISQKEQEKKRILQQQHREKEEEEKGFQQQQQQQDRTNNTQQQQQQIIQSPPQQKECKSPNARASSIQVALQQLDESMASVLLLSSTTNHKNGSILEQSNKKSRSTSASSVIEPHRSSGASHASLSTQSTSTQSSDLPSTVVASRWNVTEDDSAMYCPTLVVVPSSSGKQTIKKEHVPTSSSSSSSRRPSNIHVWKEDVGDDNTMARNNDVNNQLTMDDDDDDLENLPTSALDQRYHLEQDSSLPHGFRVVPNALTAKTTPTPNRTGNVNTTAMKAAAANKSTSKTANTAKFTFHTTTAETAHPNVSARKSKQMTRETSMTPLRLLQHELQQQQHDQEATMLLHQTLSPSHRPFDDEASEGTNHHRSSPSTTHCSLFQDNSCSSSSSSSSSVQDNPYATLPLITKQEYNTAPRIVQMQIGWHAMNHAIQTWNQAKMVTPIAYAHALAVWGTEEAHNRVVLMSLCHFRRLWLKPQDGEMWFDVCL